VQAQLPLGTVALAMPGLVDWPGAGLVLLSNSTWDLPDLLFWASLTLLLGALGWHFQMKRKRRSRQRTEAVAQRPQENVLEKLQIRVAELETRLLGLTAIIENLRSRLADVENLSKSSPEMAMALPLQASQAKRE
jgi:hypothetical protein